MKSRDRQLILYYLNNILKGSLPASAQEKLWNWAERHGQDVFQTDLNYLGEREAEAVKNMNPGRSRGGCQSRIREAQFRLLKKIAAKAKSPVSLSWPGRSGDLAEKIADAFMLKESERDVLRIFVRAMHLPVLDDLLDEVTDRCSDHHWNRRHFQALARLMGRPAGEVERSFRREASLLSNGLFSVDDDGDISISEPLKKMVNEPRRAGQDLKGLVLEEKTKASLSRVQFDHLIRDFDYLVKLLSRGLKGRERGLNILLYGPPGTGKTELAKTLAAEIGADLYPVSETSSDSRQSARLAGLQMAHTLVSGDPRAILMFDEAEDVFCRSHQRGDHYSKLFFNRMLEKNKTPVIWISNQVKGLDPAYLRRFSYALEVKTPPAPARARIWRDELARKKVKMTEQEIERLAKNYELPPSYAVSAIRAAKLVRDKGVIERTLNSLEYAVTGRTRPLREEKTVDFNPNLLNTDLDLGKLTERILKGRISRFSLCLFGAPGTGKSEYARHLAGQMGLEVLHKRASDLLDMYVGGTEANIAAAFQKARDEKKFLIFDEADSLLQDRGMAVRSWEVTQVNEMLTWMESHPYPFACTTNLMDRLDQASLRRFTFKVKYDYLTPDQARLAARHFFGRDFAIKLEALTPGDFAVAARKASILGLTDPIDLAELLAQEQAAKGIKIQTIGF